jgi:hypothetical protein
MAPWHSVLCLVLGLAAASLAPSQAGETPKREFVNTFVNQSDVLYPWERLYQNQVMLSPNRHWALAIHQVDEVCAIYPKAKKTYKLGYLELFEWNRGARKWRSNRTFMATRKYRHMPDYFKSNQLHQFGSYVDLAFGNLGFWVDLGTEGNPVHDPWRIAYDGKDLGPVMRLLDDGTLGTFTADGSKTTQAPPQKTEEKNSFVPESLDGITGQ